MVPIATSLIDTDLFIVLILALTAFTVAVSPKLKLPPTVGLVLVGLILNITGIWSAELNPDLVFYVLLPIVIFEASFNLTTHDFFADWPRTVFLAFPGVGIMCVIVGYGAHLLGQPYAVAFLFAAIVAATDPVSVVAMFRDLGVTPRLRTIIESESIMNDGTGAVAYAVTLAILTGGNAGIGWATGKLLWMVLVGMGIGTIFAIGTLFLLRVFHSWNSWHTVLTMSMILAYGSFIMAQRVGASGVLAAMMAGFIMGNYGHHGKVHEEWRDVLVQFWEYGAFFVNGLVFLLVGLIVDWRVVGQNIGLVLGAFAFTLIARAVIVYGWDFFARAVRFGPVPRSWNHVLWWGGLRGTVPVALLLTVPADFPGLPMIQALVLGTVMASLLVEGTTIPPLVKKLGLFGTHANHGTPSAGPTETTGEAVGKEAALQSTPRDPAPESAGGDRS
jgi:CPA1 family monovalent cation:H+ antiporter